MASNREEIQIRGQDGDAKRGRTRNLVIDHMKKAGADSTIIPGVKWNPGSEKTKKRG
jgi:hypothetical protein